jgi:hypothetical protein
VNATLGFGRSHVAPLISRFVRKHPQVEVQLQLSVNPPPLTDDAFDVCIRFGAPPDARVIARGWRPTAGCCARRPPTCAHGTAQGAARPGKHNCIGIRQGDEAYGVWRLSSGKRQAAPTEAVKTRGNLTTNDGEIAVNWALDGHGILMRAEWDIERYLRSGRLVQVLPQYQTPDADIHAVYPQRHQLAARVRAFVDFVAGEGRDHRGGVVMLMAVRMLVLQPAGRHAIGAGAGGADRMWRPVEVDGHALQRPLGTGGAHAHDVCIPGSGWYALHLNNSPRDGRGAAADRTFAQPRQRLQQLGMRHAVTPGIARPAATAQAVARLWLLSQHQRVQMLECRDLLTCRVHGIPGLGQPLNRHVQLGALAHLQQLRDGAGRPSGLRQRQHRRRPPAPLPLRDEEVQVAPRHQGRSLGRPVLDGGGRRDRFARAR